jgi:segregation and condensation protein B
MADELINEPLETAIDENTEVDAALNTARKAAVEAIIYVTEEPVTLEQVTAALGDSTREEVLQAVLLLQGEYARADRGLEIREIAGGYKMYTKAEHHETIRKFVKSLTPPLKLSMAALETLATIAYRQPVTVPEIQQIRGVNAVGVLKTLLERKLITTAGRKNVIGRPVLYKTTRDFLVKFGLSSLQDLPTLEEFGELARAALGDAPSEGEIIADEAAPESGQAPSGQVATSKPGTQPPNAENDAS